jgi:hypothetical protein
MVQRNDVPKEVNDIEQYKLIREAINAEDPAFPETPYGATKTAELNVQFSIDPSFGLSRERYGWFSDGVQFDKSNFDESVSRLDIQTNATANSSARIRSAYPGQYISHTVAEPGMGAEINVGNVETDENNLVSLTHGEISFELGSVDADTQTGVNNHGISYEADGTYHQVRVDGTDVAKIPQEEWNIDTVDGSGDLNNPSGLQLTPEDGYIYQFIYTWYGEGAMILAIQDPDNGIVPLNSYVPDTPTKPAVSSPNLPVTASVQNKGTAEKLGFRLGGMQYAVHGTSDDATTTRTTEESRHASSSFISNNVALDGESIAPYQTTVAPLIAARRNSTPEVEKGLRLEVDNILLDSDSACYTFIFDEFDVPASNLDGTFSYPESRNSVVNDESNILTNTSCTTYSPSDSSVLRGFAYVPSSKNEPAVVTEGDTTSRVPLNSTVVIAAALAPGSNNTTADPLIVPFREGF